MLHWHQPLLEHGLLLSLGAHYVGQSVTHGSGYDWRHAKHARPVAGRLHQPPLEIIGNRDDSQPALRAVQSDQYFRLVMGGLLRLRNDGLIRCTLPYLKDSRCDCAYGTGRILHRLAIGVDAVGCPINTCRRTASHWFADGPESVAPDFTAVERRYR